MTDRAYPGFPCMFGDRQPQFVPRSIDPKKPLPTYRAWKTDPTPKPESKPRSWKLPGLVVLGLIIVVSLAVRFG